MFCSITGNNEIHIVDPNGIKGSKQRYLLGHNAACKFSGWSPLSSNKTTLKQQLNGEKWDVEIRTKHNMRIFSGNPLYQATKKQKNKKKQQHLNNS